MDQIINTKPILFSTEMVQAILEGRKTQTRRCVKFVNYHPSRTEKNHSLLQVKGFEVYDGNGDHIGNLRDKYGKIGDLLWVRETFFCTKYYEHTPLFKDKGKYVYKATNNFIGCHKWIPSIHMPKKAARLFLKIINIRVERLQDITEADAIAEGITPLKMSASQLIIEKQKYFDYSKPKQLFSEGLPPFWSFNSLWCSINGPDSWESNPWVWVIEFEKAEKPENFN